MSVFLIMTAFWFYFVFLFMHSHFILRISYGLVHSRFIPMTSVDNFFGRPGKFRELLKTLTDTGGTYVSLRMVIGNDLLQVLLNISGLVAKTLLVHMVKSRFVLQKWHLCTVEK